MNMNTTLFKYIFKIQLKAIIGVSLFIFGVIFLFDFSESCRRFPIDSFMQLLFIIKITAMRSLDTFLEILHYIYFITATFSLWSLTHSNQLVIIKSFGYSPQQILYPFVMLALLISGFWLFIAQPLAIQCSNARLRIISPERVDVNYNVWADCINNNNIVFIKKINFNKITNLVILNSQTSEAIIAQEAEIDESNNDTRIHLNKALIINKDGKKETIDSLYIKSPISKNLLNIISTPPRELNIYQLFNIYKIKNIDNVKLLIYEIELHKKLAHCFLFVIFALIAAIICFPINRYKSKTNIAIKIIFAALFVNFTNDLFISFAYSGIISIILACWAVVLITLCVTLSILIWKEV